ncbi:Satratoxin biosynthesis SC1 cluster 4-like protein [Cladobotryum mycophilum]|uniref:Satratoxin biosynthesis SC1 cluster 4-like protein n=1 Tax=Cladobotryum mycophilum TaxID=491253 RepID=A0ABR0SG98_9HYPO
MALDSNGFSSRGEAVFIGVTVSFALATIFVAARLVCRFCILQRRAWDDLAIILAWILAFGMSFTIDFSILKGLGRQPDHIPASWAAPLIASDYAAFILYNPALMATKSSILILYIRLSKNTRLFMYWASYTTLLVVNAAGVILTFLAAFRCRPVYVAYTPDTTSPNCISIETIYLSSAPVNVATDLAILILPIPMLTAMKLPKRQKCVLVMTFMLGTFATAIDIVRIYYLQLAAASASVEKLATHGSVYLEFTYNASLALLWSAVEVNVGIICACIPVLRPLIKRMFLDRMISSRTQSEPSPASLDSGISEEQRPRGLLRGITERQQIQTLNRNSMNSANLAFNTTTGPDCMLTLRDSESIKYCIKVIIIYTFWGFILSLLTTLNSKIQVSAHPTLAKNISLICTIYGGRIVGSFLGLVILRTAGFKTTFLTGLGLLCIGTLTFWPSGQLKSYSGFVVSNFIVGLGLAPMLMASFGFLTLCGPPHHAEFRVCLGQGILGVGTVLGGLLTEKVLFPNIIHTQSLRSVQWTYLASALSTVILAFYCYYMSLPKVTDSDLQAQTERLNIPQTSFAGFSVERITLTVAILSVTFANGAWACYTAFFNSLATSAARSASSPQGLSTTSYFLMGTSINALGSCAFALLSLIVPSHVILLVACAGSITFSALVMSLDFSSANHTMTMFLIFRFFSSPVGPFTYVIGVRGQGRWTNTAICLVTCATGFGFGLEVYALCGRVLLAAFLAVADSSRGGDHVGEDGSDDNDSYDDASSGDEEGLVREDLPLCDDHLPRGGFVSGANCVPREDDIACEDRLIRDDCEVAGGESSDLDDDGATCDNAKERMLCRI